MFNFNYLNATIICITIFNLISAQFLVHANEQQLEYKPPKGRNQHQTQSRKAGGARREICNFPLNNTVTLLVPQDHVPTTISERPTFFWYVPQELPLRFTLLEPGKKPIFTKELESKPGIIALKIPQNSPPLEIGKTYRWTLTVVCSRNKPSKNLYTWALIKRVQSGKPELERSDNSNAIVNYAQSGIWYDALRSSYRPTTQASGFWNLLEQVNLSYIESKIR